MCNVLLGVTGSIAAYKAADLVHQLVQSGCAVDVVMTENAQRFITPLTLQTLAQRPVFCDAFALPQRYDVEHVALAKRAAVAVVAPATANALAKLAHGLADDLLSTVLLALAAHQPLLVAPAMNTAMWQHPATQENLERLQARGVVVVPPRVSRLACGDVAMGAMASVATLLEHIAKYKTP